MNSFQFSLLVSLFLGVSSGMAPAQQIGSNAVVQGSVFQTPASGTRRTARIGQEVGLGDRMETGAASRLQILLLDRSNFTISSETDLVLTRFVYDPERDQGNVGASVARGAFRFVSGRVAQRGEAAKIHTPAAVIGVRGTFLEGLVGEDAIVAARRSGIDIGQITDPRAALFVAVRGPDRDIGRDGRITVTNNRGTRSLSRANRAVFVADPDAPISRVVRYSEQSRQLLDARLRTAPGGGAPSTSLVQNLDLGLPGTGGAPRTSSNSSAPPQVDSLP